MVIVRVANVLSVSLSLCLSLPLVYISRVKVSRRFPPLRVPFFLPFFSFFFSFTRETIDWHRVIFTLSLPIGTRNVSHACVFTYLSSEICVIESEVGDR